MLHLYPAFIKPAYDSAMPDGLLLPAIGLVVASMCTVGGARLIERAGWALTPPIWFLAASMTTPIAWLSLQAAFFAFIVLPDSNLHAHFVQRWPSYLREVVFPIGIKLWICGGVCATGLAFFRQRFGNGPAADARAQRILRVAGGALAAAIILPMSTQYWIENGHLTFPFKLATLACAFLTGLLPVRAFSLGLLRWGGVRAHMRYAEPVAALYVDIIICVGFFWHLGVLTRPGATAVIMAEIAAVTGVFLAWFATRRGNRAAAAVLRGQGTKLPTA